MSEEFLQSVNREIRPVLEVFDRARENLADSIDNVEIPTIVVIGDQSSGKSSVLESISQVNLPKGATCVTRTPLILQLRERLPSDARKVDYATVRTEDEDKQAERVLESLDQIETEIARLSDVLTKQHAQKIVNVPIHLTIYRERQVNLTLVDLPGIYYGDEEMTNKIKDMCTHFIKNKNAVILYTTPCTTDLNTGEALALAKAQDPTSERTLTVATKIDRRDPEFMTQFKDMFGGLGVVCVRNRSQEELKSGKTFAETREIEAKEFMHPQLQGLPQESRGIEQLIIQLVNLQRKMVLGYRYKFKEDLVKAQKRYQGQLAGMPHACASDFEKQSAFKDCVSFFQKDVEQLSAGMYQSVAPKDKTLRLRARIDEQLKANVQEVYEIFKHFHNQAYFEKIEGMVSEDLGIHLPNFFVSYPVTYKLIREELENLSDTCMKIIDDVSQLSRDIFAQFLGRRFERFADLQKALLDRLEEEFNYITEMTREEVMKMLDIEKANIYVSKTSESEYSRFLNLLDNSGRKDEDTEQLLLKNVKVYNKECTSLRQIKQIKNSVHAYWLVFCNRFIDHVHQYLLFNFVMNFKETFCRKLDQEFSPNSGSAVGHDVKIWMEEPLGIQAKRRDLTKCLQKIKKSLTDIEQVNKRNRT